MYCSFGQFEIFHQICDGPSSFGLASTKNPKTSRHKAALSLWRDVFIFLIDAKAIPYGSSATKTKTRVIFGFSGRTRKRRSFSCFALPISVSVPKKTLVFVFRNFFDARKDRALRKRKRNWQKLATFFRFRMTISQSVS